MRSLLPFVITGVATGSLYGLAGLGLVLTYRTSGVFNFGHGAIAAGAAFFFYTLHTTHGVPWPFAALLTILAFGLIVGVLLETITRGLGDAPAVLVIVTTVGIMLGVEGYLFLQYGAVARSFPAFLPTTGFTLDGVNVTWSQVISIAVASSGAVGLFVLLTRSRLGIAMRSVVDNPTLVSLTGQSPVRIRRAAWGIGSAFAAMSGILLAPVLGLDANLLTFLVIQAFGACAIGLFSSLPLTYMGGILVGVAASISTKYLTTPPYSSLPSTVPYLFLILVLLVVPVSRLPQQRRIIVRSLRPATRPLRSRTLAASTVIGGGIVLLVPLIVGTRLPVWVNALTYFVIFASLGLLVWTSAQISLCHGAFIAVGATTMGHLTHAGVPWIPALLISGLCVIPVGALVAIPAFRLSGIYLALVTLGFGVFMQNVIFSTSLMFGSSLVATTSRPRLGPINATNDKWLYYIFLLVAIIVAGALAAIHRGHLGRLLRGVAESPTMLTAHGLSVNLTRLIVFCISAFLAGVAGGLAVTESGTVSGVAYGPITSLLLLAVLAISGTRPLLGPVVAALALAVVPSYLHFISAKNQPLIFGASAIAVSLIAANRGSVADWLARTAATSRDRISRDPIVARWPDNPATANTSVPLTPRWAKGENPALYQMERP